jgi:hypothetical protein
MEENVDARKERKKQRDRSFKEMSKSLDNVQWGGPAIFPLVRFRWSAI